MSVVRETREQFSTSLLPRHRMALEWLADQGGSDQKAPVIRELIEREMRARLGSDWYAELLRIQGESK